MLYNANKLAHFKACQNSTRYGFSDWYAPSISELLLIEQYANLDTTIYFSSTTLDTEFSVADEYNFSSDASSYGGTLINAFKTLDHYTLSGNSFNSLTISTSIVTFDYNSGFWNYSVRAVRAF